MLKLALSVMCKQPDANDSACRCCGQRWNLAATDSTVAAFRAKYEARHQSELEDLRERAAEWCESRFDAERLVHLAAAIRALPLVKP